MSKIILFVTVGGSHKPILTAIESLKPDLTVFICSTGSKGSITQVTGQGKPCEVRRGAEIIERLPNLVTLANLEDRFETVEVDNPDDVWQVYGSISAAISRLKKSDPEAIFLADYTGGTKTMSLALGMAAVDFDMTLYVTSGIRRDLIKVDRGERTSRAPISAIAIEQALAKILPPLLENHYYSAALSQLNRLLQLYECSPDIERKLQELASLCEGFDAWDRFDHSAALDRLESHMKIPAVKDCGMFLKRVMNSRKTMDESFDDSRGQPCHGYEIVEDLVLNAERRVVQGQFDDAVGRLYRALELLAQVRLQLKYSIDTGNLKSASDERGEIIRNLFGKDRDVIALDESYKLLTQLDGDGLGELYLKWEARIRDRLKIRNYSLFAHGFAPITQKDYQKFSELVEFIELGIEQVFNPVKKSRPAKQQFPPFWTAFDIRST